MATLVLSAVGTAIAGPLGGALGALVGNGIDHALLGSGKVTGPRLGDLSVQTSSYGSAIPKLFGTLRVAGTVIWATDLREDTHRTSGGKGGAKTTTYTYSASFAVALSARPIRSVGRIWADGNLLRGAAGDWKSATGFRLYPGDEAQLPDPLISAAEGAGSTPAHRGLAYAVFENLQLADFGNRIPSLTFEVQADDAPVALADLLAELTGGAVTGSADPVFGGFAASGDSVRDAVSSLGRAWPLLLNDDGATLRLSPDDLTTLDPADLGASATPAGAPRLDRRRAAADGLPDAVTLGYYEPARDYQAGLQSARRDGVGRRGTRIELPVALAADEARGLAEAALTRAWIERAGRTVTLPWRWMGLAPGTRVGLHGTTWRIARAELERMAVTLELVPIPAGDVALPAAQPGRAVAQPDRPSGATVVHLVDLPALDDSLATAPLVYAAAAGTAAGWRRADLSLSLDGGASWSGLGGTAAPATMGVALAALPAGPRTLLDSRCELEIELLHEEMALAPASPAMLAAGANLATIAGELLQFGSARQLSPTRWAIGRFLRGRRGTDGAIVGHAAGERFLLIEAATLLPLGVGRAALGTTATVSAQAAGEESAARASLVIEGRALRPPAPVALNGRRLADGTVRLSWVRRSRQGWAWTDGAATPLGEDAERYRLSLDGGDLVRVVEPTTPSFDYLVEDQVADGWRSGAPLAVSLVQLGTGAMSDPPATARWMI